MTRIVDLRSDTISRPTAAMREFMMKAEVGDDVFGEDPAMNKLQEHVAQLSGKAAALFVTSGTQGNQVAINAHTQPGQEVILGRESHIFNYESGAPAMMAGVQLNGLIGEHGILTVEQIEAALRPADDHYPQTGMICLENTHNRAGGTIYPLAEIKRISAFAKSKGLPLHLDGARIWNAIVASGISLAEYCQYFDSASLCFSKGLGAPVGSIVVGSKAFIKRAHFYRKAYGGGIRQGGILAAAAHYALDNHLEPMKDDHRRARQFAESINNMKGLSVDLSTVQTNMVIFDVDPAAISAEDLVNRLTDNGVLMFAFGPTRVRAVTYMEISDDDIDYTLDVFAKICAAF